ncbi:MULTISPECIES: hypothetical protein [Azospirillum]|uniref:CD-NTase-associated protein 15 domain-containing protein n=1 Tax=Azospirillum brasilense TaxID=192 RepID=A0ABU4P717_AZOBR|nr:MULTISPECIES: hypothetical protein [Azospirillum]MDW7557572.1 hypothetical protein [Azospirillum brasilense]MDW7597250.1 hypothetical protein [Azospirillum brasilense]MDW7632426.1 hypothetical protein [Azospirillum brasilense]MDX5953061.1 hypothetical protein [Azospirillum brasilense]
MLHLFPVRYIIIGIIALAAVSAIMAGYAGWVGTGDALNDILKVARWSSAAAAALPIIAYAAWRWIPPLQRLIFPYLGGIWIGELHYSGPNGVGVRDVSLIVNHTLLKVSMILDSAESTSRTLAVHAERDTGMDRDRLYYVYLTERKEGVPGAGDRYRGLAIMRVDYSSTMELHGDYFTERQHLGTLKLTRAVRTSWWKLWK